MANLDPRNLKRLPINGAAGKHTLGSDIHNFWSDLHDPKGALEHFYPIKACIAFVAPINGPF